MPNALVVAAHGLFGDLLEAGAFDGGGGAGEIGIDKVRGQPDGVEDLGPAIGLIGRNAHLGGDLQDALTDGLDVAVDQFVLVDLLGDVVGLLAHGEQRLEGEVGVDGLGAVAGEGAEMMHLARVAGLDHEADRGAQPLADQMVVHARRGQQRRNGDAVRPDHAV